MFVPYSERSPQERFVSAIVMMDPNLLKSALDEGADPNMATGIGKKDVAIIDLVQGKSFLYSDYEFMDSESRRSVERQKLRECLNILLAERLNIPGQGKYETHGRTIDSLYTESTYNDGPQALEYEHIIADIIIYKLNQDILEGNSVYRPDIDNIFFGLGPGKGKVDKLNSRQKTINAIARIHDLVKEKILAGENIYSQNIAANSDKVTFWMNDFSKPDPAMLPHPSDKYIAALNSFAAAVGEIGQMVDRIIANPNDAAARSTAEYLFRETRYINRDFT